MAITTSEVIATTTWNSSRSEILALAVTVNASAHEGLFLKEFFASCGENESCGERITMKDGAIVLELRCFNDFLSFKIDTANVPALTAFFKSQDKPSYKMIEKGLRIEFALCKAGSIHEIAEA